MGITADDLVGSQCQAVLGLGAQDDEWYSGRHMSGVWFETDPGIQTDPSGPILLNGATWDSAALELSVNVPF